MCIGRRTVDTARTKEQTSDQVRKKKMEELIVISCIGLYRRNHWEKTQCCTIK